MPRPRPATPAATGRHLPGAGDVLHAQLHAQLHAHPRRYDEILSRHLPRLLSAFGDTSPTGWFTRHREMARPDADQHLDLTLHLPQGAYGTAAEHAHTWADTLHALGLASGLVLAAYQPHTGRFGHETAMDTAHQVFEADSAAALAQIQLTGRNDAYAPQALAAASALNLITHLAPSAAEAEEWMIRNLPQGKGRLDRALRNQVLELAAPERASALAALPEAPRSPKRGRPAPPPWTPTGTPWPGSVTRSPSPGPFTSTTSGLWASARAPRRPRCGSYAPQPFSTGWRADDRADHSFTARADGRQSGGPRSVPASGKERPHPGPPVAFHDAGGQLLRGQPAGLIVRVQRLLTPHVRSPSGVNVRKLQLTLESSCTATLGCELIVQVRGRRVTAVGFPRPSRREAMLERFAHIAADERISVLCPMVSSTFDEHHPDLEAARERVERIVGELMDRAKAAGSLRTDVGVGDLLVAVAQLSRPRAGTAGLSVDRFVHRHLQVLLDGLRLWPELSCRGRP